PGPAAEPEAAAEAEAEHMNQELIRKMQKAMALDSQKNFLFAPTPAAQRILYKIIKISEKTIFFHFF
ncbi:MAG: hypothetical protein ACK542_06400, partial [Burkholderiales bacterium]